MVTNADDAFAKSGEADLTPHPYNRTAGANLSAKLTFVLGGARSGKSRYAESLIMAMPRPWAYVATATAHDREMAERIAAHRTRRAGHWQTIEAPHDLAAAIAGLPRGAAVLIDCMTMWLTNRVLAADAGPDDQAERDAGYDIRFEADLTQDLDDRIAAEIAALVTALRRHAGAAVIVSNEVGFAIVPDNPLARRFRDFQGSINQQVAASADRVVLIVAGLPLVLKPVDEVNRSTPSGPPGRGQFAIPSSSPPRSDSESHN